MELLIMDLLRYSIRKRLLQLSFLVDNLIYLLFIVGFRRREGVLWGLQPLFLNFKITKEKIVMKQGINRRNRNKKERNSYVTSI